MPDTYDGAEVRELFAAIRDTLSPPQAATYEGLDVRDRVIASRANFMQGAITQALGAGRLPELTYIRYLAGMTLGYEPMPEGGDSARYRKKPVVVEAERWEPASVLQAGSVIGWLLGHGADFRAPLGEGPTTTLAIRTLEGEMTVSPGDWIIKGVKGEFYPCKPDIFEATYEPEGDAPGLAAAPFDRGRYDAASEPQWCEQRGPGGHFLCALAAGHGGYHEAQGASPLPTWLDGDTEFTYREDDEPDAASPAEVAEGVEAACTAAIRDYRCELPAGHSGDHYADRADVTWPQQPGSPLAPHAGGVEPGDMFTCCDTQMPWPGEQDQTCQTCRTVWEREPVDLGAGARIKGARDGQTRAHVMSSSPGDDRPGLCPAQWGDPADPMHCGQPSGHPGNHATAPPVVEWAGKWESAEPGPGVLHSRTSGDPYGLGESPGTMPGWEGPVMDAGGHVYDEPLVIERDEPGDGAA